MGEKPIASRFSLTVRKRRLAHLLPQRGAVLGQRRHVVGVDHEPDLGAERGREPLRQRAPMRLASGSTVPRQNTRLASW